MPPTITHTLGFLARKGIWTLCVLCAASGVSADSTSLNIDVGPHGSVVELNGPQRLITNSPNIIERPVSGWYSLKARHSGYETWNTDVYIDASSPGIISGMLRRKSAIRAGMKALFFPGWGHHYSNRPVRGALITVTSAGLVVGFLYMNHRADARVFDYKRAQLNFADARSVAEQTILLPELERLRRRAYDAESKMRDWGYAAVGFHVYQILDAVLFFPNRRPVDIAGIELGIQLRDRNMFVIGARYGL